MVRNLFLMRESGISALTERPRIEFLVGDDSELTGNLLVAFQTEHEGEIAYSLGISGRRLEPFLQLFGSYDHGRLFDGVQEEVVKSSKYHDPRNELDRFKLYIPVKQGIVTVLGRDEIYRAIGNRVIDQNSRQDNLDKQVDFVMYVPENNLDSKNQLDRVSYDYFRFWMKQRGK